MNSSHTDCHDTCQHCHDVCEQTLVHCLERGGEHAAPSLLRALFDCAEICQTSAHFLLRESDVHTAACRACAEVCDRCAAECERIGTEHETVRVCGEVCRACARSCREMAGSELRLPEATDTVPEGMFQDDGNAAPASAEVAELAGQLYEEAGRPDGRDEEFWYEAERRLRERRPQGAASQA
jgi:Protein of unknown function (DUF2934)